MSKNKRLETIKSIILQNGTISIASLSEKLNVNKITIRRDLETLEQEKFLIRTHGGAILNKAPSSDDAKNIFVKDIEISNIEYKEPIARLAVSLIAENDSIFIGGGSTCYLFAKELKAHTGVSIVTTSLNATYELSPYVKNMYFIGGELISNRGIFYTGGPKVDSELDKIFVNKAFISVSGVDLKAGLTIHELSQLSMLQMVPKIAKQVIIIADSNKFDHLSTHKLGLLETGHIIITNNNIDKKYYSAFEQKGIKLLTI